MASKYTLKDVYEVEEVLELSKNRLEKKNEEIRRRNMVTVGDPEAKRFRKTAKYSLIDVTDELQLGGNADGNAGDNPTERTEDNAGDNPIERTEDNAGDNAGDTGIESLDRIITRTKGSFGLVEVGLDEVLEFFNLTSVPDTPTEAAVQRFIGKRHEKHRGNSDVEMLLRGNMEDLALLAPKFPVKFVLDCLGHIFDCYRLNLNDRIEISCKLFNVAEENIRQFLIRLNAKQLNTLIDDAVGEINSNSVNWKVGVSANIKERMRTHRRNFSLLAEHIVLDKISLEMGSFLELCGVVYLQSKVDSLLGRVLNSNTGFDNWLILDKNADDTSVYLIGAAEGIKKTSKKTGKLRNRNQPVEKKQSSCYYDLAIGKNYAAEFFDVNKQMKLLHKVNYECEVPNCEMAFDTELGADVHRFECHVFEKCRCGGCSFEGNLMGVQNHLNQRAQCLPNNMPKKVSLVKSYEDRLHNLMVDMKRIKAAILMGSSSVDVDGYEWVKKKRLEEINERQKKGARVIIIKNEVERVKAFDTGDHIPMKRNNWSCNVLVHKTEGKSKRNVWFVASPWTWFLLQKNDTGYAINGDFVGSFNVDRSEFVTVRGTAVVGDHTKYLKLPGARHDRNVIKLKNTADGLSDEAGDKFPDYVKRDERVVLLD